MVKCLFFVERVTKLSSDNEIVVLRAMYDPNDPEVKSFSEATPQGEFGMTVSNPDLYGRFQPRQQYYITLEERE